MADKMTSAIERITLDGATFENTGTAIVPSYINFFFGRNGAGKSTLAETIASHDDAITWREGVSRADYDVLVYNQEFIDRNFSSYGNLPGVITIHEQNIEVQEQIEQKKKEKANAETVGKQFRKEQDDKIAARDATVAQFQKLCWSHTAKIREDFKEALKGKLKSQQFMDGVLSVPTAADHDYDELKKLYDIQLTGRDGRHRIGSVRGYIPLDEEVRLPGIVAGHIPELGMVLRLGCGAGIIVSHNEILLICCSICRCKGQGL